MALKLAVLPEDPRFVREVKLLSRIHHPGVPKLVDRGWWRAEDGPVHPYIVMQWAEGLPLYTWAEQHHATSFQVLSVLAQVARALEATHAEGSRHRDVKGDNMRVAPDGTALLMDYGAGTWAGATRLTEGAMAPGTRAYRSPEALRFYWASLMRRRRIRMEGRMLSAHPQASPFAHLQQAALGLSDGGEHRIEATTYSRALYARVVRMNARSLLLPMWLLASACATTSATPADGATPPQGSASTGTQPQTDEQKTLYALGLTIGRSIGVFNLTPEELEFVRAGMFAQVKGETPAVDIQTYGPRLQELAKSRQTAQASGEKEKGKAFLEKAAQEKGAVRTESGLIYQELQAGTGASPEATDMVKVHYRGTLIDGKEFDSSYKRGEPATFPLNSVIPCWTEGVQKMKVGGKARLVCPSELAYGDRGAPPDVAGGATLVFEVELVEIQKGQAPSSPH